MKRILCLLAFLASFLASAETVFVGYDDEHLSDWSRNRPHCKEVARVATEWEKSHPGVEVVSVSFAELRGYSGVFINHKPKPVQNTQVTTNVVARTNTVSTVERPSHGEYNPFRLTDEDLAQNISYTGEGVYYFTASEQNFGKVLSDFLKRHKALKVTAMTANRVMGYHVTFEEK